MCSETSSKYPQIYSDLSQSNRPILMKVLSKNSTSLKRDIIPCPDPQCIEHMSAPTPSDLQLKRVKGVELDLMDLGFEHRTPTPKKIFKPNILALKKKSAGKHVPRKPLDRNSGKGGVQTSLPTSAPDVQQPVSSKINILNVSILPAGLSDEYSFPQSQRVPDSLSSQSKSFVNDFNIDCLAPIDSQSKVCEQIDQPIADHSLSLRKSNEVINETVFTVQTTNNFMRSLLEADLTEQTGHFVEMKQADLPPAMEYRHAPSPEVYVYPDIHLACQKEVLKGVIKAAEVERDEAIKHVNCINTRIQGYKNQLASLTIPK